MANKDQAVGARPYGQIKSQKTYEAGSTVYPGDFVILAADGAIDSAAAGTTPVLGVALNYATVGQKVLVADSPDQKFIVQSDDASVDAQTDIGLNYNITVSTADTLYRQSRMELDGSSGATDSNLPLRLLGVEGSVDNALGANVDCIVKINNHRLGNSVEGL